MAGLWAISLGIDPRFPTFSLYSVCRPPTLRAPARAARAAGAARSSMDPVLGRLVGPSMGFSPVFCSKSELDTPADTAVPPAVAAASRKHLQHSPLLSTPTCWNSPVLLYCCCFHSIYHQHLSPLILEVAAAREAAIEASSLSTIYQELL